MKMTIVSINCQVINCVEFSCRLWEFTGSLWHIVVLSHFSLEHMNTSCTSKWFLWIIENVCWNILDRHECLSYLLQWLTTQWRRLSCLMEDGLLSKLVSKNSMSTTSHFDVEEERCTDWQHMIYLYIILYI